MYGVLRIIRDDFICCRRSGRFDIPRIAEYIAVLVKQDPTMCKRACRADECGGANCNSYTYGTHYFLLIDSCDSCGSRQIKRP
jgi:hypothetical protein